MGRPLVSFTILALSALTVSGCEQLQRLGGGSEASLGGDTGNPAVLRVEEADVLRPDIFSAQTRGLWDGRFSLGGRWIAIPGDHKAERVRITNQDNGRVVEGALFQREANLPGPPIMVSMDAAEALGMLAGAPATLEVVAVRTETVEIPAPVPAPGPATDDAPEAAEEDGSEAVAEEGAAEAATATPPPDPGPFGTIETSTLEETVLGALETAPSATPAPAPAATDSGGAPPAPRIQVVSGGNKAGADAVTRRLSGAGLPAQTVQGGTDAAPIYRVVAGPFESQATYSAALAQLKELGYEDAFPTR